MSEPADGGILIQRCSDGRVKSQPVAASARPAKCCRVSSGRPAQTARAKRREACDGHTYELGDARPDRERLAALASPARRAR